MSESRRRSQKRRVVTMAFAFSREEAEYIRSQSQLRDIPMSQYVRELIRKDRDHVRRQLAEAAA